MIQASVKVNKREVKKGTEQYQSRIHYNNKTAAAIAFSNYSCR